jgi:hypothetical protein
VTNADRGIEPLTEFKLLKSPLKEERVKFPWARAIETNSTNASANNFMCIFNNAKKKIINKYRRVIIFWTYTLGIFEIYALSFIAQLSTN